MASRDLVVNLIGKDQLSGPFGKIGGNLGKVGSTLTKTLTPAAAAAGVAFATSFKQYDQGVTALRAGTGATGDALADLEGSMKKVSTQAFKGGTNMGEVGQIMADVNTNMGVTGGELETLTSRFMQLDRLGMPTSIEGVNRAFGDWGVSTDDMAGTMDKLFQQAQFSGVSIDELSDKVVQFGAPLRNLGFTMDESIALFGKWGKEGVNTETIMGGLRMGIGKLAKEGKDVPTEFRNIIESIKGAGSASDATAIAIEAFGQRAGPDLADAVRGGKFELDGFLGAMGAGKDTIADAAKDTLTLSDKFKQLQQKVMVAIGPMGELGAVVAGAAAALGPALLGFGQLVPLLGKVGAAFKALTLIMATNPFIALAIALVAIGTLIFFHREKVLKALIKAWKVVRKRAKAIFNSLKAFFIKWWPLILGIMTGGIGLIVGLIIKNWGKIRKKTKEAWEKVKNITKKVWGQTRDFLKALPGRIAGFFKDLPARMLRIGRNIIDGLWSGAKAWWGGQVRFWFKDLPNAIRRNIGDVLNTLWQKGRQVITGLWNGIKNVWSDVRTWLMDLANKIGSNVPNLLSVLWQKGKDTIQGLLNGIKAGWTDVFNWLTGLADRLAGAVGNLASTLYQKGRDLITGFINGIKSKAGDILSIDITPGFDVPGVPFLHTGGLFKAPPGQTQGLAMLRNNEVVVPPELTGATATRVPLDGSADSGVTFNGPVTIVANNPEELFRKLRTYERRNGPAKLRTR